MKLNRFVLLSIISFCLIIIGIIDLLIRVKCIINLHTKLLFLILPGSLFLIMGIILFIYLKKIK